MTAAASLSLPFLPSSISLIATSLSPFSSLFSLFLSIDMGFLIWVWFRGGGGVFLGFGSIDL